VPASGVAAPRGAARPADVSREARSAGWPERHLWRCGRRVAVVLRRCGPQLLRRVWRLL